MISISLEDAEWQRIISMCITHLMNSDPTLVKVLSQISQAKAQADAGIKAHPQGNHPEAAAPVAARNGLGGIERIVARSPDTNGQRGGSPVEPPGQEG